jgi:hypothetical protein
MTQSELFLLYNLTAYCVIDFMCFKLPYYYKYYKELTK